MRSWLRGPNGGLIVFLLITGLVGGGLGWMTAAVLRLEREQQESRAQAERESILRHAEAERASALRHLEAERASSLRLALWRIDSRVNPDLAREEGRLYNHYSFLSRHPRSLVQRDNRLFPDATVLQLSPLLTTELPDWILLHFQVDESGWSSPQDPPAKLVESLKKSSPLREFRNRTLERSKLLAELKAGVPANTLLAAIDQRGSQPTLPDKTVLLAQVNAVQPLPLEQFEGQQSQQPGQGKGGQQGFDLPNRARVISQGRRSQESQNSVYRENEDNLLNDLLNQGAGWLYNDNSKKNPSGEVALRLTSMAPAWVKTREQREYLVLVREVKVEKNRAGRICQGVVLDTSRLQQLLLEEVRDLFPEAKLEPIRDAAAADPMRSMASLPFQLDPGSYENAEELVVPAEVDLNTATQGWTPLRIGLALAWVAAGVALLAVGLGGWSLIDLSERRFRFVSAVTHELRTPLTTLRLYLDMLSGGMVREEKQREEYIRTLHSEADRLSRLVNNVLDFSRLEKQRPRVAFQPVVGWDLLETVRTTWQSRCQDAGKQLVIENDLGPAVVLTTDAELVQQVLANLIDNACKYSRDADDPHIWLRARSEGGRVVFEVEDRGPGVSPAEQRAIFRAFRRGRKEHATSGGVGLGLALGQRWARLLGGRLSLRNGGAGACFRLELK